MPFTLAKKVHSGSPPIKFYALHNLLMLYYYCFSLIYAAQCQIFVELAGQARWDAQLARRPICFTRIWS